MYNDTNTLSCGRVNPQNPKIASSGASHRWFMPSRPRFVATSPGVSGANIAGIRPPPRTFPRLHPSFPRSRHSPRSTPLSRSLLASELRRDIIRDSRAVVGSRFEIPPAGSRRGRSGHPAGVAQWQSTGFVNRGLWVQLPPLALNCAAFGGVFRWKQTPSGSSFRSIPSILGHRENHGLSKRGFVAFATGFPAFWMRRACLILGDFQSGQMGQTVNLVALPS